MYHFKKVSVVASIVIALLFTSQLAFAQEILLDQMVQAGGLKIFPIYGDKKSYYYLPDKVRIADGRDGKPQFSFIKFARNVAGNGAGGVQQSQGGGLVSFLVEFDVDANTKQRAEQELQQKVPGARIVGPVTYRSGTFAIISNFKQENGDWTQRIVGFGKAPVMEGHKAAVSMKLTKEGATILWESFKQAASDISVSFEMEIDGLRNPVQATVIADWSLIAKNKALAAGFKSTWMGFDVQKTMKELRQEQAIKVVTKGARDENFDKIWNAAYNKIVEEVFDQTQDPTVVATLQDDPNLYSNFEKAELFNKTERARVAQENAAERSREETEIEREEKRRQIEASKTQQADNSGQSRQTNTLAQQQVLPILDLLPLSTLGQAAHSSEVHDSNSTSNSSGGRAMGGSDTSSVQSQDAHNGKITTTSSQNSSGKANQHDQIASSDAVHNNEQHNRSQRDGTSEPTAPSQENSRNHTSSADHAENSTDTANQAIGHNVTGTSIPRTITPANIQNPPQFSLLAAYHEKKFKKSGKSRFELSDWRPDKQILRFDENIGGFSHQILNDPSHFRIINLDDPAYTQREIFATLDGQNSADFGKYVNYVIVSMHKKHQDGSTTDREIRIDKNNFNKSLNQYRMVYGYKGDKDREKWMKYDYKVTWNLYGGIEWDSGWEHTRDFVLPVVPPHRYREISVEADSQVFRDHGIRSATLTFYSKLFGKELTQQVDLKPTDEGSLSKVIKYAHEPDDYSYEYKISWHLRGGKIIKSDRRKGSDSTIYADELPDS